MKRLGASIVALLSIPFFTGGLLFLIAASAPGKGGRALTALVLLAIAVALLVVGLKRLRRLAAITPQALKEGALDLARRLGGELTISQFRAEYRISDDLARKVIAQLETEGAIKREQRAEREVFVFTGLLPAMVEKHCPYCGTKLPVRSSLRKCPNCGAQLELKKS